METLDFAGVQELERRFHEAVAAEDVAALMAMYADDAVILPAGAPRIDGREAIEAFWRAGIKNAAGVKLHTTHVRSFAPGVVEELEKSTWARPARPAANTRSSGSSQDRAGCWPPTSGISTPERPDTWA